jgi:DNA-binding beta-propeller fold protein YncE
MILTTAASEIRMKTLAALLLCAIPIVIRGAEPAPLRMIQIIPLPKVKGRFDHFAADVKGQRLFVAALGNDSLEVLDTGAGKRIKSIADLHKPTGVVFLSEVNQIGVANGDDGTFKLFDGTSFELVNSLGGLDDADNTRRDLKTKLIYVGYADGALAIVDETGRKKIGEIKLKAHPESFQLEANGQRIFVNVPDAKQVAVVDREKRAVIATWPMTEFRANFPMALDETNHRLFVGCRHPARLVVLDTATGKALANTEISGDTDDLFHDAAHKRIYVTCGEGFIDVIKAEDGNNYPRIMRFPTSGGARTSFFSTDLGSRIVLAVPQRIGRDAEIQIYATGEN